MPNYLALDWTHDHISGIEADVSGSHVRVLSTFRLDWPDDARPNDDAVRAGQWLRGQFDRLNIATRQCLVSLPREDAVVRHLELPRVPDEELPDMVRLQAATVSTMSLSQFMLDFMPLPDRSASEGRDVLMATIPVDTGDRIQRVAAAAEITVESISISPVAMTELVARAERSRGLVAANAGLIVARHGQRVEISLLRGSSIVFSHSTQVHGDDVDANNRAVVAEVNRTRYAQGTLLDNTEITRGWVIGAPDETTGLRSAMEQRLNCAIESMDPFDLIDAGKAVVVQGEGHAAFAGPVGLLLGLNQPIVEQVNFLNPRKMVKRLDRQKLQRWIAAAAAGLMALVGFAWWQMQLSELDRQIESVRKEVRDLKNRYDKGKSIVNAHDLVQDWSDHSMNWLEQMQLLNEELPGTEKVLLTEYRFDPGTGDSRAFIRADGFARARPDVEELNQTLKGSGFVVHPTEIKARRDSRYSHTLSLDLSVPIDAEKDEG